MIWFPAHVPPSHKINNAHPDTVVSGINDGIPIKA